MFYVNEFYFVQMCNTLNLLTIIVIQWDIVTCMLFLFMLSIGCYLVLYET